MKLTFINKRISPLFLFLSVVILSGCSSPIALTTSTPTMSSTETPSPTIVWFPPTNTPTIFPTQALAPTENYHPGLGNLIFSDSFDQPEMWSTSNSDQASATLTRNRLVLSITGPGPLSIISLRSEPLLGDFYAEAQVDISLCSGKDQYGMVWRAAPGEDHYRYAVNCNGQERIERVRDGVAYPLIDWMSSGDAPAGAPAQVKLGVWTVGHEIRLFLNGNYQFSLTDPVFSNGTLGFFVFANGQTPVTISFSNLAVYSVSYVPPTPTPAPAGTAAPSLPQIMTPTNEE
jgi:hypothetical protein